MGKAVAYARYSTDLQNETSIEDQVRRCRELAAIDKVTIGDDSTYADKAITGQGSGTSKRLAFRRLLDAWDAGLLDFVYATELARLTRDAAVGGSLLERVEKTGVVVVTADGIDTRRQGWQMHWMMLLATSGAEVRSVGTRTTTSMRGVLERGGMIAAPPFGYSTDWTRQPKGKKAGALWVIEPNDADLVRELYRLRRSGLSFTSLAAHLNDRGIPSPRLGRNKLPSFWRASTMQRMLSNGIYKGEFVYQGSAHTRAKMKRKRQVPALQVYKREEFRLIDDELWNDCNPPPTERQLRGGTKHLLAGFIVCGDCESKLSVAPTQTSVTLRCPGCEGAVRVKARGEWIGYTSEKAARHALKAALAELMNGSVLEEFRARLRARLEAPATDEESRVDAEVLQLTAAQQRLVQLSVNPAIGLKAIEGKLEEVTANLDKATKKLLMLASARAPLSPAAVKRHLQVQVDPLLERLLDGEPVLHETRATLGRLISRFALVARPGRGCSVFEVTFVPGAYVAHTLQTPSLDITTATFRITVTVSWKKDVPWAVDVQRI